MQIIGSLRYKYFEAWCQVRIFFLIPASTQPVMRVTLHQPTCKYRLYVYQPPEPNQTCKPKCIIVVQLLGLSAIHLSLN